MKINEVIKTTSDNLSQKDVEISLSNFQKQLNDGDLEPSNEKIKNLDLYQKSSSTGLVLVLVDNKTPAAYLSLRRNEHGFEVNTVGISQSYKRQGYIIDLYKYIVKNMNNNLISGFEWTKSAEMLWKKLKSENDVKIKAFNLETQEEINVDKKLPKGFFKSPDWRLMLTS